MDFLWLIILAAPLVPAIWMFWDAAHDTQEEPRRKKASPPVDYRELQRNADKLLLEDWEQRFRQSLGEPPIPPELEEALLDASKEYAYLVAPHVHQFPLDHIAFSEKKVKYLREQRDAIVNQHYYL